jgi:hypothetical protein
VGVIVKLSDYRKPSETKKGDLRSLVSGYSTGTVATIVMCAQGYSLVSAFVIGVWVIAPAITVGLGLALTLRNK